MKKLLGTLLVAPLAIASCTDAAKAPTSIEIPAETDAKKKVVADLNRASLGLKSNDLTKIDNLCSTYFDASFTKDQEDCKGYFAKTLKANEDMGVETGLKFWEFKELSGDDTAGWDVPVLTKTESKITNQAKFDKLIKDTAALTSMLTEEELRKSVTDGFANLLKFGATTTYKLVKSGDSYKVKSFSATTHTS